VKRTLSALFALLLGACSPAKPVVVTAPQPPSGSADLKVGPSSVEILREDLAAIFDAPRFERALWSVLIRPVSSDEDLFSLNPAKLVMPGSTMKILTVAAAAEALGWNHRFETRLVTTAPLESGVLRGDLVVVGGGDPSISERSDEPGVLQWMARQLRDAGVRQIEGGIIGDDDVFDDKGFGDGWTLDNVPYGYSAPVGALVYNEGSVDLVIRAGTAAGEPVGIQVRPEGSGLVVENRLVTVPETGTGMLTMQRLPGSSRLVVQGQIPARAAPFARTASVDNPTEFFVSAFRNALATEGIAVAGDAIDIDDFASKPDLSNARTIAVRQSPPLSQLATSMMRVSQNQYAEILLKAVGATIGLPGAEAGTTGLPAGSSAVAAPDAKAEAQSAKLGTAENGRRKMRELLKSWGIPDDGYIVADGSGLSRYNYVTAEALIHILQQLHERPAHASMFPSTLPVAGRDGTLAGRLVGTPAEGRVRAKTGTVDNVRAISGYVQTADEETLVFSIIANNFNLTAAEIDAAADQALIRLATLTRQP
jgi:serine-type D-Ala-D-Ala carboxypeptidase/endopeptidase (penicillin-binding protein 4)